MHEVIKGAEMFVNKTIRDNISKYRDGELTKKMIYKATEGKVFY